MTTGELLNTYRNDSEIRMLLDAASEIADDESADIDELNEAMERLNDALKDRWLEDQANEG